MPETSVIGCQNFKFFCWVFMFFSFTDELWTWAAMNMTLVARARGSVGSY